MISRVPITNSYAFSAGAPVHSGSASLALRVRVAAHRDRLTRDLAEGVGPATSPELALRAAQLTSSRRAERLARSLRRTVKEAHNPPLMRQPAIIDRRAVLEARDAIEGLIARLSYAEPVNAQGMAIAERMLTNASDSPLYGGGARGALRQLVLVVLDALEPENRAGHEFALAV